MKKSYEIDMCHGPLWGKLLVFSIPLMLSGILQLLFNAVDVIVVGRFSGSHALAAVGATGSLINLFVNVFIGCSIGTNVLVGRYYGMKDRKNISETIHTSIEFSFVCGVVLTILGLLFSKPMLQWMDTPPEVLNHAVLYMKIYFIGMPAMMLYNFGAAVLRAIGDTKRPLYYLSFAGLLNVVLNLFFVVICHMGIAGVAIATIIAQAVSAILVLRCLLRTEGMCRFEWKKMKIHKDKLIQMVKIGLPAGMQGALFSISNVLIQSSINSFGAIAVAGSTASSNLEGFVYTSMNAIYQTALSFTSQNMGVNNQRRIGEILRKSVVLVTMVGLILGNLLVLFAPHLLKMYSTDQAVIASAIQRMKVICIPYFLCGIMDVLVGSLRGMGYSIAPMLVALTGVCGLRVLWIYTVFAWHPTLFTLFMSYPVTWIVTGIAHWICWIVIRKILRKKYPEAV